MSRHALLVLPSANRVYRASAPGLAVAELRRTRRRCARGTAPRRRWEQIAGVPYLAFSVPDDAPLTAADLAVLGHLSVFYALFTVDVPLDTAASAPAGPGPARGPARRRPRHDPQVRRQDQRAVHPPPAHGHRGVVGRRRPARGGGLAVLDPLCGRGTTLSQALLAGHSAAGRRPRRQARRRVRDLPADVAGAQRLKHRASFAPVRRSGATLGRRFVAELGPPSRRSRRATCSASRWSTPTRCARPTSSAGSFDVLVTDAPYGVQHATRRGGRPARTRSPCSTRRCPSGVRSSAPAELWASRGTPSSRPGPSSSR